MPYCVITSDVRQSRNLPERAALQQKILRIIEEVNRAFARDITVPFSITIGDEWQGVLKKLGPSYKIITLFEQRLRSVQVAFGIGQGEIATSMAKRSTEMNGEVFHRSREALNAAKKSGRQVVFCTLDSQRDLLLNALVALLEALRNQWTARQYEKVMLYAELRREADVAAALGISQVEISKTLKSTRGRIYLESENNLNKFLDECEKT